MSLQKNSELACTYAALILHDEGVEITQDKLKAIIAAAGVEIESYYPMMFAKYLDGKDLGSMLTVSSGGGGGGAAPAAGGGAAPAAEEKKEEKKVVEEEEEDDDMGFGLFD
jgi:large subunit ribosomal protein LP1|uniref:60S acidic ribosomal protein P1 n=1 Tax=Eutreptiella gymnastica TaxID=73025 RepID=A0A7S4LD12_9EUGL|mmetsp:Transcript_3536/g.5495  ORF Transcript_3536/g.5495 Transcript_3536/m.5495 type:complete len:111 (-) Transcript_3536:288-620(-)|eukprot:CAMPEP_0174281974 /NCGR_PEP_ID=MMETSP0809-20121228/2420_1 /TAXON_ID=73025 ORGANISM="Eutreptiella gymnastica-like, Strain CCMP1594" /NCGR_SAMPLE_ID=MMETSP0809 /ASSEMBLY_ACC=CAM_ASM_000658 /LENGTH=110 /DNA_ID=CAMNT_0015375883 /DNA_START=69 /DNA_END=401 /DNA_ORIENTATION=+